MFECVRCNCLNHCTLAVALGYPLYSSVSTSASARADDLVRRAREPRGARGRGEHEQREQHAEREHERAVRLRAHGERHAARVGRWHKRKEIYRHKLCVCILSKNVFAVFL